MIRVSIRSYIMVKIRCSAVLSKETGFHGHIQDTRSSQFGSGKIQNLDVDRTAKVYKLGNAVHETVTDSV